MYESISSDSVASEFLGEDLRCSIAIKRTMSFESILGSSSFYLIWFIRIAASSLLLAAAPMMGELPREKDSSLCWFQFCGIISCLMKLSWQKE